MTREEIFRLAHLHQLQLSDLQQVFDRLCIWLSILKPEQWEYDLKVLLLLKDRVTLNSEYAVGYTQGKLFLENDKTPEAFDTSCLSILGAIPL
jgi:hypothetical protein